MFKLAPFRTLLDKLFSPKILTKASIYFIYNQSPAFSRLNSNFQFLRPNMKSFVTEIDLLTEELNIRNHVYIVWSLWMKDLKYNDFDT